MLAPHIRKKVDRLWDRFWSAGLTNPLVAIEQITYLLFLKRLEDIDLERTKRGLPSIYDNPRCRWTYIRQEKTNPQHLIDTVFPWLRKLEKQLRDSNLQAQEPELKSLDSRMSDAYFQLDPNKGQVLGEAIDLIDQLFARAGEGSAAQDVMGDTFEYLLNEVSSSGKNGQFRTPRHLIRFMIELLDPQPGKRVIDPAAGTSGFLFSAQQYMKRQYTTPESLRLEWDGTPHRTYADLATPEQDQAMHDGKNFVGLDNDRTMARIGWMNMILHGINDPQIVQGDSLSKRSGKDTIAELLKSETYDFVFANPPFTGTVDTQDLEPDSTLFPRGAMKGKKSKEAITNKSELLFCWLILDLLDVGGRCAVIVPEGVMFGTTDAHVRLRRELLTEHTVEGVISLPGGVFQPYTGVKTSILIFRKETRRADKQSFTGKSPRTKLVWFYEVEDDGYTKDAKRNPRPDGKNDLWDAIQKFHDWVKNNELQNEKTYFKPKISTERWQQSALRDTDGNLTPLGAAFHDLPEADQKMFDGQIWGIHELFTDLPSKPEDAEHQVEEKGQVALQALVNRYLSEPASATWQQLNPTTEEPPTEQQDQIFEPETQTNEQTEQTTSESNKQPDREKILELWNKTVQKHLDQFNRVARDLEICFEKDDSKSSSKWKNAVFEAKETVKTNLTSILELVPAIPLPSFQRVEDLQSATKAIAREFAKLEGFDVRLRSLDVFPDAEELKVSKHWVVPVRSWARNDDWVSSDGKILGSHDDQDLVRPEYVQAIENAGLYDKDGNLLEDLLDPDCIESMDWLLAASQYKPFDFTQLKSEKSVLELIEELKNTETQILSGLEKLRAMVQGRQ